MELKWDVELGNNNSEALRTRTNVSRVGVVIQKMSCQGDTLGSSLSVDIHQAVALSMDLETCLIGVRTDLVRAELH